MPLFSLFLDSIVAVFSNAVINKYASKPAPRDCIFMICPRVIGKGVGVVLGLRSELST